MKRIVISTAAQATRRDRRYTVGAEWVGYQQQRYVVRFCGDYVVSGRTEAEAWELAAEHAADRINAMCA